MFVSGCSALDQNGVTSPTAIEASDDGMAARGSGGGGKPGSGGGSGSSSLTLAMVNDADGSGSTSWGDQITFTVSTNATTEPHVDVACYQSGTLVYGATTGFFASYPWPWTQVMTLQSQAWQGGAAQCTATLYHFGRRGSKVTLATNNFAAGE